MLDCSWPFTVIVVADEVAAAAAAFAVVVVAVVMVSGKRRLVYRLHFDEAAGHILTVKAFASMCVCVHIKLLLVCVCVNLCVHCFILLVKAFKFI